MNIRYVKRHLPFRNTQNIFLKKLFRTKSLQLLLAVATLGISLSGASVYVMQASAHEATTVPVSPIPQTQTIVKEQASHPLVAEAKKQFKKHQQLCEQNLNLTEKQIEASLYLQQMATTRVDKQKIAEELEISEARLSYQLKACNDMLNKLYSELQTISKKVAS